MNKSALDASIPMLTEIIDPVLEPEPEPQTEPAAPAVASATVSAVAAVESLEPQGGSPVHAEPQPALGAEISPAQWQALETTMRERILLQLQNRIDFVLEHRVRDSLADVLQTAVSGLADEIRAGLQHTLKEVIERAVAQEIAKLQSGKPH